MASEAPIPGVLVYMTYEDFFDDAHPAVELLVDRISQLPRAHMIALLCNLNAILSNQTDVLTYKVQRAFIEQTAPDVPYVAALLGFLETHPDRVIVSEEQVGVIFRLVVQHASGTAVPRDLADRLLRIMLLWIVSRGVVYE
jgi:hypothetical protein